VAVKHSEESQWQVHAGRGHGFACLRITHAARHSATGEPDDDLDLPSPVAGLKVIHDRESKGDRCIELSHYCSYPFAALARSSSRGSASRHVGDFPIEEGGVRLAVVGNVCDSILRT
jgi:hypothetical protein